MDNSTLTTIGSLVTTALLCITAESQAAQLYNITKINTLGGSTSTALSINDLGQVVGHSNVSSGDLHPYVWNNGVMTDLGTLGGVEGRSYHINNSGTVFGTSFPTPPQAANPYRATVWSSSPPINLGTFGGTRSTAWTGNEAGQAAGGARQTTGDLTKAFYWDGVNPIVDIGTLPGGTIANVWRMNNNGFDTGYSGYDGKAKTRVIVWNLNNLSSITRTDLGTLGGTAGDGYGINELGQVVGYSTNAAGTLRAFYWGGSGPLVDLQTLGGTTGEAYAISDNGQIVGRSRNTAELLRATLWDSGKIHDLTSLISNNVEGWVLDTALNINDAGAIVGRGTVGGVQRGFVLTPIPEPTTLSLLACAGLLALRRRRSVFTH